MRQLNESGSMPGVGAITKQEVFDTVKALEEYLDMRLTDNLLGSAGKKNISGDIDIAVNIPDSEKKNFAARLKQIPIVHDVKVGAVVMSSVDIQNYKEKADVAGRLRTGVVQVDFMFTDNVELAKVGYHSPGEGESKYKGAHRNLALAHIAMWYRRRTSKETIPDGRPVLDKRYKFSNKNGLVRVERRPAKGLKGYLKRNDDLVVEGPWTTGPAIAKELNLGSSRALNSFESLLKAVKKRYPKTTANQILKSLRADRSFESLGGSPSELAESARVYLEEGARIQHLEDHLFWEGSAGAKRAISVLKEAGKKADKFTLKWDGSPAVVFGREGKDLLLTDKNGYNAKGYDGKATSERALVDMLSKRRNADQPSYQKFIGQMAHLYSVMDSALEMGARHHLQGDVLFFERPPIENGAFVFRPNVVEYHVDVQSPLGQKIAKAKCAIAVHDKRIPAASDDLLLIGPVTPGNAIIDVSHEIAVIEGHLKRYSTDLDRMLNPDDLRAKKISDFPAILYNYVNNTVEGVSNKTSFTNFINEHPRLTAPKKQNVLAHVHSNLNAFTGLWHLFEAIVSAKINIIDKFDNSDISIRSFINGQPGGEGWVADGEVLSKLVDRNFFTKANRAMREDTGITFTELSERLSVLGRRKKARKAKQSKSKLARARKRASKKTAPMDTILKRAQRRARTKVAKQVSRGQDKSGMSAASKSRVEDMVDKRSALVKTFARKAIAQVRKDDRAQTRKK